MVAVAAATAGYSAFLFGQAEGRDFWQSPLLLPQLLGAAVVAGAAALLIVASILGSTGRELTGILFAGVLVTSVVVALELYGPHANKDVAAAADYLVRGPRAQGFWIGYVLVGVVVTLVLALAALLGAPPLTSGLASVCALVGLWFYEDAWVRAGQSVAIS
jgi:formate-dependent nitrite reductase membrane component NrfD